MSLDDLTYVAQLLESINNAGKKHGNAPVPVTMELILDEKQVVAGAVSWKPSLVMELAQRLGMREASERFFSYYLIVKPSFSGDLDKHSFTVGLSEGEAPIVQSQLKQHAALGGLKRDTGANIAAALKLKSR